MRTDLSNGPRLLFRERTSLPAKVIVSGSDHNVRLNARPVVGAKLDVGFPVIVTACKDVPGCGWIVAADRIDSEVGATEGMHG